MKTTYIPKGMEVSHMSLTTEHLVVDGSLTITGTLKAKTIGGRGFVEADMDQVAEYIALAATDFQAKAEEIRAGVAALTAKYPIYR